MSISSSSINGDNISSSLNDDVCSFSSSPSELRWDTDYDYNYNNLYFTGSDFDEDALSAMKDDDDSLSTVKDDDDALSAMKDDKAVKDAEDEISAVKERG